MADYDWFDRTPSKDELDATKYRPLGFDRLIIPTTSGTVACQVYRCRRGCGTLVWNPEEHMKNVCTQFNPRAGSEDA